MFLAALFLLIHPLQNYILHLLVSMAAVYSTPLQKILFRQLFHQQRNNKLDLELTKGGILSTFNYTRRFCPLCGLSSSSCSCSTFGFRQRIFALSGKTRAFHIFCCWCFLVTSVTFSSNLSNYDKNQKNQKRIQKSDFF